MKISFQHKRSDLQFFSIWHQRRSFVTYLATLAVFCAIALVDLKINLFGILGGLLISLGVFLFIIFMPAIALIFKNDKTAFAPCTVEANEDGIVGKSEFGESLICWKTFIKTAETKHYFLVYFGKYKAYLIPKRVFDSPEKCQEFIAFVKSKVPPQTKSCKWFCKSRKQA